MGSCRNCVSEGCIDYTMCTSYAGESAPPCAADDTDLGEFAGFFGRNDCVEPSEYCNDTEFIHWNPYRTRAALYAAANCNVVCTPRFAASVCRTPRGFDLLLIQDPEATWRPDLTGLPTNFPGIVDTAGYEYTACRVGGEANISCFAGSCCFSEAPFCRDGINLTTCTYRMGGRVPGAWNLPCSDGPCLYACCRGQSCNDMTAPTCASLGGVYHLGLRCTQSPCNIRACCMCGWCCDLSTAACNSARGIQTDTFGLCNALRNTPDCFNRVPPCKDAKVVLFLDRNNGYGRFGTFKNERVKDSAIDDDECGRYEPTMMILGDGYAYIVLGNHWRRTRQCESREVRTMLGATNPEPRRYAGWAVTYREACPESPCAN